MQQNRIQRVSRLYPGALGALFALSALLGGCGSTALRAPHAGPRALMTDSDRYAECLYEAYQAYEDEVAAAEQFTYPSAAAAQEAAVSVNPTRFDELLAAALHRHGFTVQGLQLHASRHDDFVQAQRATYRPRLSALRQRVVAIAGQIPTQESWALTLLDPAAGSRLASR